MSFVLSVQDDQIGFLSFCEDKLNQKLTWQFLWIKCETMSWNLFDFLLNGVACPFWWDCHLHMYGSKRCCLAASSDKLCVISPLPTRHIIRFTYDRKFPESCYYIRTKVNSAALSYEVLRPLYISTAVRYGLLNLQWKCIFIQCQNVAVFRSSTKAFWDQSPGEGGGGVLQEFCLAIPTLL